MRRTLTATVTLALALLLGTLVAPGARAAGQPAPYPVSYNFLLTAVTAGLQMNGNPPGANDWTCRPSTRHPRPVVLVHGTIGNRSTNWQTYAPLLANNGYCVYALTYGVVPGTPPGADQFGGMAPMEDSAAELAAFITRVRQSTGAAKVDLVGHSQGTLMPNYYVKFMGGARYVDSYISLAPLWHGTRLSSLLPIIATGFGIPESRLPTCAACAEFAPTSAFLKKMRTGAVAVPGVKYTNIMTRHDELVSPYTSGSETGMTNIVLQDRCGRDYTEHFEMAADPIGAAYVLNALDPAHPRPVPCTLVLPFTGPVA